MKSMPFCYIVIVILLLACLWMAYEPWPQWLLDAAHHDVR